MTWSRWIAVLVAMVVAHVRIPGAWAGSYRLPDYLAPGLTSPPPSRAPAPSLPATAETTLELTLDQALAIGLAKSRQMRILEHQLEADLHEYRAVKAQFHPRIISSSDTTERREFEITQRLSAEGTLSLLHKISSKGRESSAATLSQALNVLSDPALRQAGLGWAIAQLTFLQGVEDLKFSVIQQFFEVLRNQELLKSQEAAIQRTDKLVEISKAKYDIGISSKLDWLNTQVLRGRALTAAIDGRARLAKSIDELRDLLGIVDLVPLQAAHPLEFLRIHPGQVDGFRRDLEGSKVKVRLAVSQKGEARQRANPDVKLDVKVDELQEPEEIVAGLKYTLAVGGRPEHSRYHRQKHLLVVEENRYQNFYYQVRREKRDIVRILAAREQAVEVAQSNLKNAEESYEYSRLAFERGMINNIDLRDSQDKLTQARDAFISNLIDYMTAGYQYVKVFGGTL